MAESTTPTTPATPAAGTTKPVAASTTPGATSTSTATPTTDKKPDDKKPDAPDDGQRFAYLLKVTIGELVFSNQAGDFLGTPVIRLRTRQFSEIDITLNALRQVDGSDAIEETKTDDKGNQTNVQPVGKPQNAANQENLKASITTTGQTTTTTTAATPSTATGSGLDVATGQSSSNSLLAMTAELKANPTGPPTNEAIQAFLPQVSRDIRELATAPKPPTTSTPDNSKKTTTGGDMWAKIKENMGSKVKVEVGYPPAHLYTVLEGQAYRIGRRMPDGVILEVVDSSAVMAKSTTGTNIGAAENPPTESVKVTAAELKALAGDKSPPSLFQQFATGELSVDATTQGKTDVKEATQPFQPQSATGVSTADLQAFMAKTPGTVTPTTTAAANPNSAESAGVKMQAQAAAATTPPGTAPPKAPAEQFANQQGLQFSKQTQAADGTKGTATFGVSPLQVATTAAAKQGDVVVAEGNQVKQVGPGQGEPTGVTLDWNQHKNVFIKPPTISKKTPLQLQSGAGAVTVQNFSVGDKSMQSSTVVTPGGFSPNPNGVLTVPEWSSVKLGDPIIQGGSFTWGQATAQGERKPESKSVMQGIVGIAQVLEQIQKEYGVKLELTSWYRDPATNVRVSSSGPQGPHTTGSAADFYCDPSKLIQIFKKYDASWPGGVAIHPAVYSGNGGFVHLDLVGAEGKVAGGLPGSPGRRWTY